MKAQKKEKLQRVLFISAGVLLSAALWTLSTAQVKIGGDPTTPVTTRAVLERDGASGGLLLPRVQVLPPAASASEGTMYYQISDGTVYIFLIDGGKHWEPVGSGNGNGSISTSDYAEKAKKLAYGMDSAKLAGIAAGANFVLVENILTSTATMNALSAAQGRALLDSIRNRSREGTNSLNAFRDSVYKKAQTLGGNKTLNGNTAVGGTLAETDATTLTGNLTANGATASFPNANPTVKAKSAPTVLGNTTQLATEAQVALAQNTVNTTFLTLTLGHPKQISKNFHQTARRWTGVLGSGARQKDWCWLHNLLIRPFSRLKAFSLLSCRNSRQSTDNEVFFPIRKNNRLAFPMIKSTA
ncbi:hypothetical protein AGMMS49525_17150 [Bacteroidia bacterium]|nr:hypothetical protein AGMMS49525_17150 [Bacteroidia bacterium]